MATRARSIPHLRTKPKSHGGIGNCSAELTTLLTCWATTSDVHSIGTCSDAAKGLSTCMATTGGGKGAKRGKPTINYHLARLGKGFK